MPALSFGTATFGGSNDFFKAWGSTNLNGASRLIDICLDHGVSMFDTADVYSDGLAEVQLLENIGAIGWALTDEHISQLELASATPIPYPVWHQRDFPMLNENL